MIVQFSRSDAFRSAVRVFGFVQTHFGALFVFSFSFRRVSERCSCFISFRRISKRCSCFRFRSDAFRSAVHAFVCSVRAGLYSIGMFKRG